MYKADGVGLAAPQVGILKRVVVIDVGNGLFEMINPEIIEQSGEQDGIEGCLSIPGTSGEVVRPMYVKAKYTDRNGETVIIEAEELFARAICHELDHLDGILYKDKAHKMYTAKHNVFGIAVFCRNLRKLQRITGSIGKLVYFFTLVVVTWEEKLRAHFFFDVPNPVFHFFLRKRLIFFRQSRKL